MEFETHFTQTVIHSKDFTPEYSVNYVLFCEFDSFFFFYLDKNIMIP